MRILLIEDDVFFQRFYSLKLRESGFTVDTAADGSQGLALMQKEKPDLILLDIIMPKTDGFTVLARKATLPELKDVPVIVFSTLGQEEDMQRALQLGAKAYINKSFFDFGALLKKIQEVIGAFPQKT